MKQRLRVLSPHRDDAAFSLCTFLSNLSPADTALTVSNFFTISGYAPWTTMDAQRSITAIRRCEDRKALRFINPSLRIVDHNLVDAPLRLGIPVSTVCNQDSKSQTSKMAIETVGRLNCLPASELALAPLGLGNHIDHLVVRAAALESCRRSKLGFYEDLPYARWTTSDALGERVREVEGKLKTKLRRYQIKRESTAWARKKRAISRYQSQITLREAEQIARWGEAIWIPARSKYWNALLCRTLFVCR